MKNQYFDFENIHPDFQDLLNNQNLRWVISLLDNTYENTDPANIILNYERKIVERQKPKLIELKKSLQKILQQNDITDDSVANNLLFISFSIRFFLGKEDFNTITRLGKRVESNELELRDLKRLFDIDQGQRLTSISFTFEDDKHRVEIVKVNSLQWLYNLGILIRKYLKDKNKSTELKVKSRNRYGEMVQHWGQRIFTYLGSTTNLLQKDKYLLTGEILKISGLPVLALQGDSKGKPIIEGNYHEILRKTYKIK